MHPRTLKRLAAAFALLAAGVAFHVLLKRAAPGPAVLWEDAAQALRLRISRPGAVVSLERPAPGGAWRMKEPLDFRANQSGINHLLAKLGSAEFSEPLSVDPEALPLFELDESSAIRVQGWLGDPEPAFDLLFGRAGSAHDALFVRRPGEDEVREARGIMRFMIAGDIGRWADLTLCAIDQTRIVRLEIEGRDSKFALTQSSGRWSLDGAGALPERVVKEKVQPMLSALTRLQADDILLESSAHFAVLRGLQRPELVIRVRHAVPGPAGRAEESLELIVGPQKPGFDHPVRKKGVKGVLYELKSWRLESFRLGPADLSQ